MPPLDQPAPVKSAAELAGDQLRMTVGEHIEELRQRLIYAGIGCTLALLVTLYFGYDLVGWLAAPILQAMDAAGFTPQTYAFEPDAGFRGIYLKVSIIAAAILASPWILYQAWQFVVSGLYAHERRAVYVLAPFSTIMTLLGVAFSYYVLLPICLVFFMTLAKQAPELPGVYDEPVGVMRLLTPAPEVIPPPPTVIENGGEVNLSNLPTLPVYDVDPPNAPEGSLWINRTRSRVSLRLGGQTRVVTLQPTRVFSPMPELSWYINFASFLTLGVTAAFQVPVVMLVLGRTGLIDPKQLRSLRKYAFFASFIVGAVLTPTDITSMLVLAVPLYLLFEFGLLLMRVVDPHRSVPAEL